MNTARWVIWLSAPFLIGCVAPQSILRWNAMPASPPGEGAVQVVQVINKRPEKKGADDLNRLGNVRSGWGIPYSVSSIDAGYGIPIPADQALRQLIEQSLLASGLAVTTGPPSAQILIEVLELWSDGYANYNAKVSLDLVVLDPQTRAFRARIPLRREGNGGGPGIAYPQALDGIHADAIAAFRDPRVRASLIGGMTTPAAAPGGPPTAGGGGCSKDTDCKGDRVCDRGQCVTPR
jgi:hypothetical protein